ncbi:MAG: Hsp20/alpha crystallin family protein [Phycisphaerae bacterium]|nr:Hsp20/alpha crystallin family protein [Phycisphaerae bacterium]
MNVNPFSRDRALSLRDLQNEFDQILERLWHGGLSTPPLDGQDWAPHVDVVDEPLRYVVRVEVPGLTGRDVEVSMLERVLTIKGVKPATRKPGEDRRYLRAECRFGSFQRRIDLPDAVDVERITAQCANGVLEVEIPKKSGAAPRTVKVAVPDEAI